MADRNWANNGSYQDMSALAKYSLAPTSQAGGNMIASNAEAMTAPGSQPVDNLDDHLSEVHEDPAIEMSNSTPIVPGTNGKPRARTDGGSTGQYASGSPAWGRTTVPQVVRKG